MKTMTLRMCAMLGALLMLGAMLCACGTPAAETNGYGISLKGVPAYIGQVDDVKNTYGDPVNYAESGACGGIPGMDRVYQYAGFTIYTTPAEGNKNVINKIELTDDTYSTAHGLTIGSTKDAVRTAMGDPTSETDTSWSYVKDSMKLTFVFRGDSASAILYQTK